MINMINIDNLLDELYPEITEEEKESKLNDLGIKSERQIQEEEIEKVREILDSRKFNLKDFEKVEFPNIPRFAKTGVSEKAICKYLEERDEKYTEYIRVILEDGNTCEDVRNAVDLLNSIEYFEYDEECLDDYMIKDTEQFEIELNIDFRKFLKDFKVIKKEKEG